MNWLLNREAAAVQSGNERDTYLSVSANHYRLRLELPLGLTAKQFYDEMQSDLTTCVTALISGQVEYGEVIEIDDGLKPYYFYYSGFRVVPLTYFNRSQVQPSEPAPSKET